MRTVRSRPEQKLPNGEMWKNIVTEEKSKVAETLAEFRGNYKYNLLDKNVRAFNAEVPMFSQWDDHEVTNNWWPGEPLTRAEHQRKRYVEKNALLLAARASRAFHEYMPIRASIVEPGRVYRRISYGPLLDIWMLDMRSYRGPNGEGKEERYGPDAYFLGPAQLAWLKRGLLDSRATWKVIAADMPIGLIVQYDGDRKWGVEAVAQGDGPPLGRELEIADLLSFIKHAGIRNTVWLTADVHYTAAHYYDPNKAVFQDFEPFWEFVSGPIHAGTFGPNQLDNTFGPAAALHQGAEQGARPKSAAQRRPAVLWPCRDRRRHRGDDRDAQGRRRSGAVVDQARAEPVVSHRESVIRQRTTGRSAYWPLITTPGLPQHLADRHGAGHRHIERAQSLPHRDDEPRVGRPMHLLRHARGSRGRTAGRPPAGSCDRDRTRRRRW